MAMSRAVGGIALLLLITLDVCSVSAREGHRNLLAIQGCECGCLIKKLFGKGCAQCNPCTCSCPTGHVTNKWEKQTQLENKFCAGKPCEPNGCCGGVRYSKQEGGTEVLNMIANTTIACASCNVGCGACAGTAAAELIKAELAQQVQSIVVAIQKTAEDLNNKASEFGTNLVAQVKDTISEIADDIVRTGKFNRDGAGDAASRKIGNCKFTVEPGMNTYNSKTCVWCCNCVNNLNAVRFYLAWRLDCTGGGTTTGPIPVAPPATQPPPETVPAIAPPAEVCEHNCKRCGQGGPCAFGKCSGPCKKCCWTP